MDGLGKGCLRKEFQKGLPSLFQVQRDKSHYRIRICPGQSGIADAAKKKNDSFRCDIDKVLDYLSYLFDLGFEYRTIGCHRCTISVHHEYVDNKPVGQYPRMCLLLKGVFNQRPARPRCVFIQTFLDFVKCQWSECDLSDKVLTYKLVILMALSST